MLYDNHYCLKSQLHTHNYEYVYTSTFIYVKHVYTRRLTAFETEDILNDNMERCIKQQPTNIGFIDKEPSGY